MNEKQIEAYNYFRELYPGAVILYHISDNYVALGSDAVAVAKILGYAGDVTDEFGFPSDDASIIGKLGDVFQLKMIDYRNDDGELDYPDVGALKQEKYDDY